MSTTMHVKYMYEKNEWHIVLVAIYERIAHIVMPIDSCIDI